ncbi:MAG: mechanosensitive ion channel family protein, partial [Roseiarcus sp.]
MADPTSGDAAQALGMGFGNTFPAARAWLGDKAGEIVGSVREMIDDAVEAPGRAGQAAGLLTDNGDLGSATKVVGSALAALAAAVLLAVLVQLLIAPVRARLAAAGSGTMRRTAMLAARSLLVDLVPPAVYLAAGLGLGSLLFGENGWMFSGSEVFRTVLSALAVNSAIAWLIIVTLSAPLAVGRPVLRIVPLDDREAQRTRNFLLRVIVLGAGGFVLAESLFLLWFGAGLPRLILIVLAMAIGALCLNELAHIRSRLDGFMRFWHKLAVISVFGLALTWVLTLLIDSRPATAQVLGTLAVLAGLPMFEGIGLRVLRLLRHRLAGRRTPARTIFVPAEDGATENLHAIEKPLEAAERAAAQAEIDRAIDAFLGVLHSAFCTVLGIVAAVLLAKTWSLDMIALLSNGEGRTFIGRLVDAAATLLVGWYAWRLFETGLRLRLSREAGGAEDRARTLRPLLSSLGKGVIGAISLMSALAALGLNIAPLIASAGVVGIAVGLGAQTLVKDLVSGVFFLIEDVFRIGEYIESGNAKGTVEKITFRTVALRHQNGPLHY